MSNADEELLIEKAGRGDDDALVKLWNIYQHDVPKITRRFLTHGFDRDDFAVLCRAALYEAAQRYDSTKSTFRNWFFVVATRSVINFTRQNTTHNQNVLSNCLPLERAEVDLMTGEKYEFQHADDSALETFNQLLEDAEYLELVKQILEMPDLLTAPQKEVIRLKLEDPTLSQRDLAHKLRKPYKHIDNVLTVARTRLRNALQGDR